MPGLRRIRHMALNIPFLLFVPAAGNGPTG